MYASRSRVTMFVFADKRGGERSTEHGEVRGCHACNEANTYN